MDLATAYQTLGLQRDAPADEIKARYRLLVRRYHPDVRGTGNSQKFILVNAAYALVLDALHGREPGEELRIPDEVVSEAAIERKISGWFTALWGEYQSFRDSQVRMTKEHISRLVQGAASGLDLKNRVKKDIELSWVEMGRKIEDYVGRLIRKAAKEEQGVLYNLFRDLYEVGRKHWVETLYRNPVVVIALFVFIVLTVLPNYPGLDRASPLLFAMASTPWLSFAPIQGLVLYMLFKLWVQPF